MGEFGQEELSQYCVWQRGMVTAWFCYTGFCFYFCIARAERDGRRAETRFRLSPKRTSPFKSVGASVQSNAGSRGLRISFLAVLDIPRSEVAWEYWLPTPFASFPFTSPPMRHRVPPGSERALTQCWDFLPVVGKRFGRTGGIGNWDFGSVAG